MGNRRAQVPQAELVRIATAMKKTGVEDWRADFAPDGTIRVIAGKAAEAAATVNDWDVG